MHLVVAYAEAYTTFLCSHAPFSLCWTGMHCPSQINPQCLAKQLVQTNQRSPRRIAWQIHFRHCMIRLEYARFKLHKASQGLPVCTEETDKEAVTEKKRGGKIISASSLCNCTSSKHTEHSVCVVHCHAQQTKLKDVRCWPATWTLWDSCDGMLTWPF